MIFDCLISPDHREREREQKREKKREKDREKKREKYGGVDRLREAQGESDRARKRERKEKVLGTTAVIKLLTNRRQGLLVSINTPPHKKNTYTLS